MYVCYYSAAVAVGAVDLFISDQKHDKYSGFKCLKIYGYDVDLLWIVLVKCEDPKIIMILLKNINYILTHHKIICG